MEQKRRERQERKGILVLKKDDEKRELDFELAYLSSLSLQERFVMMSAKSQELKTNLAKNGYRTTPSISKRK